jgi:hypothetical protein
MKKIILSLVVVILGIGFSGSLTGCQGTGTSTSGETMKTDLITASELFEAIKLAEGAFASAPADPQEYSLVRAERMLAGDPNCTGTRCWQLVFKLNRLIPTALPARLGAGGELFFTVDLDAEVAVLTGWGE